jgi:hypothetical protein
MLRVGDDPRQFLERVERRRRRQGKLAAEAMHLIVPQRKEGESVPLSAAVSEGGTISGKR